MYTEVQKAYLIPVCCTSIVHENSPLGLHGEFIETTHVSIHNKPATVYVIFWLGAASCTVYLQTLWEYHIVPIAFASIDNWSWTEDLTTVLHYFAWVFGFGSMQLGGSEIIISWLHCNSRPSFIMCVCIILCLSHFPHACYNAHSFWRYLYVKLSHAASGLAHGWSSGRRPLLLTPSYSISRSATT
jgi:hypothetical protein